MEWILGREKMQGHTNRWFMRHRRKLFHYRHRTIFKAFCINWQMECTINIMRLIGEKSWPLLPSHFYPKSSGAENCIFLRKRRKYQNLKVWRKGRCLSPFLFSSPHFIHFSTACWFQVVKKQLKASPLRLLCIVSVYMWHFRRLKCYPGVSTWY